MSETSTTREPANAQHSASSGEWGTPIVAQELAAAVMRPVRDNGPAIDVDLQSSAYWHSQWSEAIRPSSYVGLDHTIDALRDFFALDAPNTCGLGAAPTAFVNPAGVDGGDHVKRSWERFAQWHITSGIASGFFVGFSLEQFATLQSFEVHPLDREYACTIVPSRRARYRTKPSERLAVLERRFAKLHQAFTLDVIRLEYRRGMPDDKRLAWIVKEIFAVDRHVEEHGDAAIAGDAPTHSSYFTVLWHKLSKVRAKQQSALRKFLAEQKKIRGSLFERCAVIGKMD